MLKKIMSSFLIVAMMNLVGCYSSQIISGPDYQQIEEVKPDEILVKTIMNEEYQFAKSNFHFRNDSLYGNATINQDIGNLKDVKIAISDIKSIETETYDATKTWIFGLTVGVVVAVFIGYQLLINADWSGSN